MIPKEGSPGTAGEHEGLHARAFGLDSVHQIVSGPCMKHLSQGDGAECRMLYGPPQVIILHGREQDKAFLTRSCERGDKLGRSLCIRACDGTVWVERLEILSCQKST